MQNAPKDQPRYAREVEVAVESARAAAAFIRDHAGEPREDAIRDKGIHDLVTYVDEEAERIIKRRLTECFPDDEILAEESAEGPVRRAVQGRRWIIDPLDGTTNFLHGVPPYAVSIALQDAGVLVVGVVLDVAHDELFTAEVGQGLHVDGRPSRVSDTDELGKALIATGFPFRDYGYLEGYLETLSSFMRATRGVRRPGSAAIDLAWVACGRFDGSFEAGLAPWDTAAGVVLVEAGGGRVSGLPEGADAVFGGGIISSNGWLHEAIRSLSSPLGRAYGASNAIRDGSLAAGRD